MGTREETARAEKARMLESLKGLDGAKVALAEPLIEEASFMKAELIGLKRRISAEGSIETSSLGNQRQSESAKLYVKVVAGYSAAMKAIYAIVGRAAPDGDDELDEFMRENRG